jgi:hypothetical protein
MGLSPTISRRARRPVTLLAESWNVQALPEERIVLETDQRLVVRISAPADEVTLDGTVSEASVVRRRR